ncbi:hypothetical protein [Neisseria mucosa]|uniref:hypothetical protein n=1 Tax=Neisseria mucosa TaxID=488 RepID=UPI0027E1ED54|nr:hypothetical protein [Neisseria mucosa]MDU4437587.1 hypothetical protein [Neisseria sp.]
MGFAHEKQCHLSPDSKTKRSTPWAKPRYNPKQASQRPTRHLVGFAYQEKLFV